MSIASRYYNSWFYRYIGSAIAHPKRFIFCQKYPFWKTRNVWTGKFCGYYSSMYEWIEDGWRTAFGKQLTEDIVKALKADGVKKRDWCKVIHWEDIKEKYGTLRLYASAPESVQKVLSKYECMSYGYCQKCGKPARYSTKGWVGYYCATCYCDQVANDKMTAEDLFNLMDSDRLTKDDLPVYSYSDKDGNFTDKSAKEAHGVDLEKLWGLKE